MNRAIDWREKKKEQIRKEEITKYQTNLTIVLLLQDPPIFHSDLPFQFSGRAPRLLSTSQ